MSLLDRLDALKAQEASMQLDEFAAALKALHLEERAEINAAWSNIATEKQRHIAERRNHTERLASAKKRREEAAHHIAAAQRKLDIAREEVAREEACIAMNDQRIAKLGRDIEAEYIALSSRRERPVYDYFSEFMKSHPTITSPSGSPIVAPSPNALSLPTSPLAKATDVVVDVVEVPPAQVLAPA